MRLDIEISKSAVLLANEHQINQKNVTNDFHIHFRDVIVHAKRTLPENAVSRISQK